MQRVKELTKVGVWVVAVPVKDVVPHIEVVTGEVGGRVLEVVVLVPQQTPRPEVQVAHIDAQTCTLTSSQTLHKCKCSIPRSHRAGVGMMRTRKGTSTRLVRGSRSPCGGGLVTVKRTMPVAMPS